MKAHALKNNCMTPYMVPGETMEVNPKRSIMTWLRKRAAADRSDKTVKDLIGLLFYTLLLTSGLNFDETTRFAVTRRAVSPPSTAGPPTWRTS